LCFKIANKEKAATATWFDLGCELQRADRHQEALSAFRQAQAIDSGVPYLKTKIGFEYCMLRDYSAALPIYESQVREVPNDLNAWNGLSFSAHRCRQWDKSLAAAERAFKLNPNNASVLHTFSIILAEFRRFKRARRGLERAVTLAPQDAEICVQLALRQLEEGDYRNGWKTFEARWKWKHWRGMPWVNTSVPRWAGERLEKKNVLVWNELWQGLGDSILFARYAPLLAERAKREDGLIMFVCHEPLYELFSRSLVEHCNELLITTRTMGMAWQPQDFFRGRTPFQCSLISLPLALGEISPQFPYLTANPAKVAVWRERLSGTHNMKIGLAWTGRADHPRNDLRSVPILDLVKRCKIFQASRSIHCNGNIPSRHGRRHSSISRANLLPWTIRRRSSLA
jgi:Flp pilus assembly protein TadD